MSNANGDKQELADQVYGDVTQPNDPAEPPAHVAQPDLAPAPRPIEDDDAPAAPPKFYGDDKRAAYYARRRDIMAGVKEEPQEIENVEALDPAYTFAPPFAQGTPEPDAPPAGDPAGTAPEPAASAAEKRYTLKVNHNQFEVTRDQLVLMAGISNDEAADLPDSALVRAAQLVEASKARLAESRQESPPAGRPGTPAHHAGADRDPTADADAPRSSTGTPHPSKRDLVAKIQLGDEDEAAEAIDQLFDLREQEKEAGRRAQTVGTTIDAAMAAFKDNHPDVVSNPRAMTLATVDALEAVKQNLVELGFDASKVATLNQEDTARAYREAAQAGYKVKPIDLILDGAAQSARSTLGIPPVTRQPTIPEPGVSPQQQPSAHASRTEAKQGLVQIPQRAGAAPSAPPAPPSRETSRKATLDQMRASRGQAPLGA